MFFQITSRGKIRALLQKNFLRMWRNVGVMLFIFVLPVMQVILFCLAIGRDPTGLRLAISNMEMNDTIVSTATPLDTFYVSVAEDCKSSNLLFTIISNI